MKHVARLIPAAFVGAVLLAEAIVVADQPITSPPVPFAQPPHPQAPPPAITPQPQPAPAPAQLADDVIAWDAVSKEYTAKPGEAEAKFAFNLTNVSSGDVTISGVATSCGCTVAKLPTMPWKLAPGESGQIPTVMNIAGKPPGAVFKTITVSSDKGNRLLTVKAIIEAAPPQPAAAVMDDRTKNQMLAKTDPQAIFKGDCASCHVDKAKGKMGKELYVAACGICHEAEHRATMVTDLRNLKVTPFPEYWRYIITNGKQGTLMPPFSHARGGPLTEEQISSLVNYLSNDFPKDTNVVSHASAATTTVVK